jgi:fibronectin type 3 domain-containing protein
MSRLLRITHCLYVDNFDKKWDFASTEQRNSMLCWNNGIMNIKFSLRLALTFIVVLFSFFIAKETFAATSTVCASGCDYTTITAAVALASSGDTISVQSTYASTTEVFPLAIPANVIVDCGSSGAEIGASGIIAALKVIIMNSTSTIRSCSLSNVQIGTDHFKTGMQLRNNVFNTNTTSTIAFAQNFLSDIVITGNTGITQLQMTADNVTVTNNTFHQHVTCVSSCSFPIGVTSSSNVTFTNNTITRYAVTSSLTFASFQDSTNVTFATNTLSFAVSSVDLTNGLMQMVYMPGYGQFTVSGNYFSFPASNSGNAIYAVYGFPSRNGFSTASYRAHVHHNTFSVPSALAFRTSFLYITDNTALAGGSFAYVTSTYNLFDRGSQAQANSTESYALVITRNSSTSTMVLYEDYDAFWRLNSLQMVTSGTTQTLGSNARTGVDPAFKLEDASSSNDLELARHSLLLDVDSTNDIGAYSAARGSSFTITSGGTVDYSSVDATTTSVLSSFIRDSDTWTVTAGTYDPFTVSSTTGFAGSATITGAGVTTKIRGTSSSPVILQGVSGTTVKNLVAENASSTSYTYYASRSIFTYNGNSYGSDAGYGTNVPLFIGANDCDPTAVLTDNTDITSYINANSGNIHLGLADMGGGTRIAVFVANSVASSAAALSTLCGGAQVDRFVTSTFSVSSGVYTYDSSAVAAASVTTTNGFTSPPTITRVASVPAGFKFSSASSVLLENVTSTGNAYGVWFTGTSANNNVSSTELVSNVTYDVLSEGTGDNNLKNVTFTRTSSSITGTGNVKVYYRARIRAVDYSTNAISGATATFTSANGLVTSSASTTSQGYTNFSDMLLAHIMTSTSTALTTYGYNPYTFSLGATSTYVASSTSASLSSPNSTVTIAMDQQASTPSIPTNFVATVGSTSTISLSWTAVATSTGYKIYRSTVSGSGFSLISTIGASSTTSYSDTGLTPYTTYYYTIGSTLSGAESASSTESSTTTNPIPNLPTNFVATVASTSTINLTWTGVTTSTGYKIYRSTSSGSGFSLITTISASSTTSYSNTGLSLYTTYYYTIGSTLLGFESASSSESSTTTNPIPNIPTNLVATANGQTQIDLSWTAVATSTGYKVYQSTSSGGSLTLIATIAASSTTTYSDTGLTAGTSYYYKMISTLLGLESATSSEASAQTAVASSGGGSGGGGGGSGGGGSADAAAKGLGIPVPTTDYQIYWNGRYWTQAEYNAMRAAPPSSTQPVLPPPARTLSETTDSAPTSTVIRVVVFTRNILRIGTTGADVKRLQQFLNTNKFLVAKAGPGSPGKETDKFGAGTSAALKRYQIANLTKIYGKTAKRSQAAGFLDAATRTHLNRLLTGL